LKITELKQNIVNLFIPPFTKRKMLHVGIALIIIILVVSLLIAVSMQNTKTIAVPNQNGKQSLQAHPTITPNNLFPQGGIYQMPTYTIAYPQGSLNTTNTFEGGTTLIIQPPNYPHEPLLDIEAYNSPQNLEEKKSWYLAAGATQNTLVINNMKLQELKNTYKMRTINSKPIHTPTQLRLAYLVKPQALYVFRMYYSSKVSVPADEELFTQFIKSFTLKK